MSTGKLVKSLQGSGILSIKLLKVFRPLYQTYAHPNPKYQPSNLELWDKESAHGTIPACVALSSSKGIKLRIEVENNSTTSGQDWVLEGKSQSGKIIVRAIPKTFEESSKSVGLDATLYGWSSEVPWGVKETTSWQLINGAAMRPAVPLEEEIPIEIYAVIDDIAPFYEGGLPLEFLRIMLLPTLKEDITSLSQWIESAVIRCHASALDPDLADKNGQAFTGPIHCFRYDTWAGLQKFSSGISFHMDAWLTNREDKERWMILNCYDQSALVQVTLGLGVPYTTRDANGQPLLEDGKMMTNYGALWKGNFGYIKPTDLVGWGLCDNPFFKENVTRKLLHNPEDDPTANSRDPFKTHKWVYYRLDGEKYALDACAGPVAKPMLVADYLEKVIDPVPTKAKFPKDNSEPEYGVSITALDPNPVAPREDRWISKLGSDEEATQGILKQLRDMTKKERSSPDSLQSPVPVEEIYSKFRESLCVPYPDREYFSRNDEPVSIGQDGARVVWRLHKKEKNAPVWISLTINVLNDCDRAVSTVCERLMSMDVNAEDVFELSSSSHNGVVSYHLEGKGEHRLNISIYKNLVVQLDGLALVPEIKTVAQDLDKFITGYKPGKVKRVNMDDVRVEYPTECKLENPFNVKIMVCPANYCLSSSFFDHLYYGCHWLIYKYRLQEPATWILNTRITYVRDIWDPYASQTADMLQLIMILQDPPYDKSASGEWIIPCIVDDRLGKEDWLKIVFAAHNTWLTNTARYQIKIIE